jgi:hypothetical protein
MGPAFAAAAPLRMLALAKLKARLNQRSDR